MQHFGQSVSVSTRACHAWGVKERCRHHTLPHGYTRRPIDLIDRCVISLRIFYREILGVQGEWQVRRTVSHGQHYQARRFADLIGECVLINSPPQPPYQDFSGKRKFLELTEDSQVVTLSFRNGLFLNDLISFFAIVRIKRLRLISLACGVTV